MWGPRWAAQITPTVFVWCPFTPCGTQSSFAPWLPSGTHAGHAVQVVFWYMGPMWEAPDLPHVGYWYMGPMWAAPDLPHVGFWHMGPMLEAPDLSHVGFWYMGRMWAAQIAPTVHVCALLAQVGPSRHLHRGTHPGPMLVIAVLYLNLTYFWYLLTLGLVVTDCYLKYMYQIICEIDPCLIIEQNQRFVNAPNF